MVVKESPALIALSRILVSGIGVLSVLIVARAIGPVGRGETAAAIAAFYVTPIILGLGIPLEIRRLAVSQDISALVRASRLICIIAIIPSFLISCFLYFTVFSNASESARVWLVIGVTLCPLMIGWMCINSILVVQERYRAIFLLQLSQPLINLMLISVFWLWGVISISYVLFANIVGTLTTFVMGNFLVKASLRGYFFPLFQLLSGGLKYAGSAAAEAASNRLDQILVLPLVGAYQAGLYSVAVTIGSIPLALGHALAAPFFKVVAMEKDQQAKKYIKEKANRAAIASGIGAGIVLAVFSYIFVPIIFGEDFAAAIPVVNVALIGSVAMIAAYVGSMLLAAEGRGIGMTISQVSAMFIGVALLYVFAPRYGAIGAAMASSISYFVLLGILQFYLGVAFKNNFPKMDDFKKSYGWLILGREK